MGDIGCVSTKHDTPAPVFLVGGPGVSCGRRASLGRGHQAVVLPPLNRLCSRRSIFNVLKVGDVESKNCPDPHGMQHARVQCVLALSGSMLASLFRVARAGRGRGPLAPLSILSSQFGPVPAPSGPPFLRAGLLRPVFREKWPYSRPQV